MRAAIAIRKTKLHDPACTPEDLRSSVVTNVDQFSKRFLTAGIGRSSQIYQDDAMHAMIAFNSLHTLITAVSIVALFFFYWIVYSPMIKRLDREIKHVRMLLLLFPDEVARGVPGIIQAGRDLLKDSASVSGSSSVAMSDMRR